jgi:dihydrofolate reductase
MTRTNPFPAHQPPIFVIAALNNQRVIGIQNQLPWHIPDDLKRFKALTMGHRIVMGRKTFESIGKPLPGRENVVISRSNLSIPGVTVTSSLGEAFAPHHAASSPIFMIGGAQLYEQTLTEFAPRVQRLYLTLVDMPCDGDAHFPAVDFLRWHCERREPKQTQSPPIIRFEWQDWARRPD